MNFIKWISCQLGPSLRSSRSLFDVDSPSGGTSNCGTAETAELVERESANAYSSSGSQASQVMSNPHLGASTTSGLSQQEKLDPLKQVDALQIKFLRLLHRIGVPPSNSVVAQVLHRLHLASLIQAGESDMKRPNLKINKARIIAAEQETTGQPDLDLPLKILLLGKTGVGKSATINSIFDERRVVTDAFLPATDRIQRVEGTIRGVKVTAIDTPGLSPSYCNQGRNRKLLHAVRRFIKRSPPDIVLYFERLDHINRGYNDYPLLKLITDVLGSPMWFNTVLVLTHCSSSPPEGPDGYSMEYDACTRHCASVVQRHIQVAVSNAQLENPVALIENHSLCRRNIKGERVLPNGQVWVSQLLLLCGATKVLSEANSLLKFQDSFLLSPANTRLPSLPHLLSSLLRHHASSNSGGSDGEVDEISDDDDDEYDQLPPFRILKKAQYDELTKDQKEAYLDELDYRETLLLKKQWREGIRRQKLAKAQNGEVPSTTTDDYEETLSPEVVHISDMEIPLSFDSDYPVHRYRCYLTNDQWFRAVLDPQGWDHDVGFDGINFEASQELLANTSASVMGQMRKDKEDLYIHAESSVNYTDLKGCSLLGGVDVQTASKDLICTFCGDAKFRNFSWNTTGGGISVTKFCNMYFVGTKLEDSISVGRRVRLTANAGRMAGCGQVAHGGGLEMTVRGKDYPVREESIRVAATILSFEKEIVIGGDLQSDFRVGRGSKMSVSANLNSRKLGQFCIKTSTSDHIEIALLAAVSLIRFCFRRISSDMRE